MMNWEEYLSDFHRPVFDIRHYLQHHAVEKIFKFPFEYQPNMDELRVLADFLKINDSIKALDLSECEIGVEGMKILAPAIEENFGLHTFQFAENGLGTEGCDRLCEALQKKWNRAPIMFQVPITLGLRNNQLTANSTHSISQLLEKVPIRSLNVANNALGPKGMARIFRNFNLFNNNQSCLELNAACTFHNVGAKIDWNDRRKALAELSSLLKMPHNVQKLDLSANGLTDGDFTLIAKSIGDSTSRHFFCSIKELRLHNNRFTSKSFEMLANLLLDKHHAIEVIDLTMNKFRAFNDGLFLLKEALRENYTLRELSLAGNLLNEQCRVVLLDAVIENIMLYYTLTFCDPLKYNLWVRIHKFNEWLGMPCESELQSCMQDKMNCLFAFGQMEAYTYSWPTIGETMRLPATTGTAMLTQFTQNTTTSTQDATATVMQQNQDDEDSERSTKRQKIQHQ